MADSIGTAGLVVIVVIGLYTRVGDARAALIALMAGVVGPFVCGEFAGIEAPWMCTLVASLALYLGCAWRYRGAIS